MANITQTIPNLTQGISQQPDEYMIPGQVRDMVNALPDVSQGLQKRPAGKFVGSLSDFSPSSKNCTSDGRWFHYYRDDTEQYIGQVAKDGTVRMYDCLTGNNVTVVDATSGSGSGKYLYHTGDEDIQTLTLNDFTYINNRNIDCLMDNTVTAPLDNFGKEVYIDLKAISYAKQYAVNIFDQDGTQTSHFTEVRTATRIRVDMIRSSNNYCDGNGFMVEHSPRGSQSTRCDDSAGDGRDAYAPNVGTQIFAVDSNKTLYDTAATGGTKSGGGITDTNYDYPVRVYEQGSSGSGSNYVSGRSNLYFRVATTGQSVPYTTGTGENMETTYQARYTTTYDLLYGGEGWKEGDFFHFWMKDAFYKLTVEAISTSKVQANLALARPNPTPFDTETTITAESILGDIRTSIIAGGNISANDVTIIGNGLYIKRTTTFNASTPVNELLNVVSGSVNDIGDLPSQCKNGMVVEVVNSIADEDNHYVKFIGENGRDGKGTWREVAKPGREIQFKYSTMPIALIRTADGNFRLTELDGSSYTVNTSQGAKTFTVPRWDNCLSGDEVTNKPPSFIGQPINKLVFFRNRFGFLSEENIILSRPGDFTNFWPKSAIQLIGSDPIDVSASSRQPAKLFDAININTGLVLFSESQQFMLTTDSDSFTPLTAKINNLAYYNFNVKTNPVSLGTSIGFLDNAGKKSRFWEMADVVRQGEPNVIEQSAVVSKLFESDLTQISNSEENGIIFFSEEGSSTLYGYKYFQNIRERKLAAWFKWTLTGEIQYHCMQDDSLFVVVKNGTKYQMLKYSLKMDANTYSLHDNRVHLDHLMKVTSLASSAFSGGKTTFTKPTGLESSNQLVAYDIDDSANPPVAIGRFADVSVNGNNLEITGDWTGQDFLIGYEYTMSVTLPTIYYKVTENKRVTADTRAHTVIHRVKIGFGPVGVYETTLQRIGRPDYTELFEVTPANTVLANSPGVFNDEIQRTIPIYERNINATLTIKSTHPAPATMHNYTWEGVYTDNFYKKIG